MKVVPAKILEEVRMSQNNPQYIQLAKQIFKLWQPLGALEDVKKYDNTLHHLLESARRQIIAGEWSQACNAIKNTMKLFDSHRILMASDGGLREEFSKAVMNLYLGISSIGLQEDVPAEQALLECAKRFELAQFPLGATLTYFALGRLASLSDKIVEARQHYQEGLDILRLQLFTPLDAKAQAIKEKLEKLIVKKQRGLLDKQVADDLETNSESQTEATPTLSPSFNLGVLEISQWSIPGGEAAVIWDDNETMTFARVDRLCIEDVLYRFIPLKDDYLIWNLFSNNIYRAFEVKGDSMDEIFDPGDYAVLVSPRVGDVSPKENDIVAVQFKNDLGEWQRDATLKEFHLVDNMHAELRPRSKNREKHKPKIYPIARLSIRAIAIGRLQRLMNLADTQY